MKNMPGEHRAGMAEEATVQDPEVVGAGKLKPRKKPKPHVGSSQ